MVVGGVVGVSRGGAVAVLVAVPLEDGGEVVIEMDEATGGVVKAGRPGEVVGRAVESLESALDGVTLAARSVLNKLGEVSPDGITVEFGIKLTAEANAVITKTTGECNFKVSLHWERRDEAGD